MKRIPKTPSLRAERSGAKQSRSLRSTGLLRRAAPRNDRVFVSRSARDTERIASAFAKTLHGGETILLDGDLGAGKTVFVRGLAKGLGIRGHITSPTFVLMRVHERARERIRGIRSATLHSPLSTLNYLIHIDAYRVRDARELVAIGLLDWIGRPDTVVAIEWGDRVRSVLSSSVLHLISITQPQNDDEKRSISVSC